MNSIDWRGIFTNPLYLFVMYVVMINIVTFLLYGVDKVKAKRGWMRISEMTLLTMALLGGSLGALFGVNVWHHKTNHWKFRVGIPLILLLQIALMATLYFVFQDSKGV